ncbi:putative metalloprotease [Halomicronema hongdechloris C2206]|uniref:Metalloprotease n=1 Tax=Halomicronema hongdechloris C2206 TaxID=1641165 RepID=A0A1Z3HPA6_9CYAN|nr:M23 family metallopeptidase [Halomicronema hongdechloris]ASC72129.1 putative metalloprotease [Halomicronema hongdechloris C2206]
MDIRPSAPELGDTIAVIVQSNQGGTAQPTVQLNGQAFPVFPLEAGRFRALLPTSPLNSPGRYLVQVIGDEPTRNLAVWLKNRHFSVQRITLPPDRASIEGTPHEFERVATFKQLVTPERHWQVPFLRPSQGRVSTPYGVRRYYNGVFARDYYHRGVDYAAATGSAVIAPAAGRIVLVGRVRDGFRLHGNTIGIDHGQGVASIFIHLSRIDVTAGEVVQAGQQIGGVGSTGVSTGPHLHWGLYVHGVAVDPVPWRYGGIG